MLNFYLGGAFIYFIDHFPDNYNNFASYLSLIVCSIFWPLAIIYEHIGEEKEEEDNDG